ncbi:MAG: TraX family protein [Saccharofermentanales bacterium]
MLKWLALLFMTIDHTGYYFYPLLSEPVYYTLRIIGRLAFPIFAFYIVRGFSLTSNRFRYLLRMVFWALIAHFSISAAAVAGGLQKSIFDIDWTNVMVLFVFAIIMLMGYDLAMRSYHDMVASMTLACNPPLKMQDARFDVRVNLGGISLSPRVGVPLGIMMIITSFWLVGLLNADYEIYGLLTVLFIYISYSPEDNKVCLSTLVPSLVILNAGYVVMAALTGKNALFPAIQTISIASVLLFNAFPLSHKRPSFIQKYFFYAYYPGHIVLLIFIFTNWDKIISVFR